MTVAGTHNLSDWGTDVYLAAGKIKSTNRYKQANKVLKEAKRKYHPKETVVSGHSLRGIIAGYIASKDDRILTLDKGATAFQPIRKNIFFFILLRDDVGITDNTWSNTLGNTFLSFFPVKNETKSEVLPDPGLPINAENR
jgi:predicted alpha/beta-fold hydrolase